MKSVQGRRIVDNINSIKFIGLGHKGIELVNKISQNKKDYINLATIDIKGVNNNPKIKEHINYANDIYEWCWWCKCDFFELIDTIGKKGEVLNSLIKDEKLVVVICEDSDLVSLHTLLEFGKISKQNNSLVLPVIIQTDKKSATKESDSKFFIKKINRSVGPVINICKNDPYKIGDEYEIINLIIDMFLENIMSPCSCNLDYEDIQWLFEDCNNSMQISITNINEEDLLEDIKSKVIKSVVSRSRQKMSKKIIINAKAPKDKMNYNQAFRLIQQVAKCLQEASHEDCRITFSLRFEEKEDNNLDILTIQV